MANNEKFPPRFNFAVDCDIILNLSLIADGKSRPYEKKQVKDAMYKLWPMVYSGDVKLYITPQTLCELGVYNPKFDERMASREFAYVVPTVSKFVRKFCHPIYINPNQEQRFKKRAKELALCYVKEAGFEYKTTKRKDGTEIIIPSKDAKALAEASLCGLSFLTCNSGDFIATLQEDGSFIPDKLYSVIKINKKFGLGYKPQNVAWTDCPIPMSAYSFINSLPDCYMDIPFLKDTEYDVVSLRPYEIDSQYKTFFKKFDNYLQQVENGEINVREYGIRHPYWYVETKKGQDGKETEEIVKF